MLATLPPLTFDFQDLYPTIISSYNFDDSYSSSLVRLNPSSSSSSSSLITNPHKNPNLAPLQRQCALILWEKQEKRRLKFTMINVRQQITAINPGGVMDALKPSTVKWRIMFEATLICIDNIEMCCPTTFKPHPPKLYW